jgi:hypothetical protein
MDEGASNLEDWRGVDIGQIRELLQLSVADRAAEMVRVSNLVIEAQNRVKAKRGTESA